MCVCTLLWEPGECGQLNDSGETIIATRVHVTGFSERTLLRESNNNLVIWFRTCWIPPKNIRTLQYQKPGSRGSKILGSALVCPTCANWQSEWAKWRVADTDYYSVRLFDTVELKDIAVHTGRNATCRMASDSLVLLTFSVCG